MAGIKTNRQEDIERVLDRYGDMLFRFSFVMVKNRADAEDVVQDTILKYLQKAPPFENEEHEKNWLFLVASNQCRDLLRFRSRHDPVSLEEAPEGILDREDSGVLEALLELPEKYRVVLQLYYVEDRTVSEIAKVIERTDSAVKMRLKKGRELLKTLYRKEYLLDGTE